MSILIVFSIDKVLVLKINNLEFLLFLCPVAINGNVGCYAIANT